MSEAFKNKFGDELDEDALNESHQIILVAASLDDSTERIINYLNVRDLAINVIFFQVVRSGEQKFLSRAWLIYPSETQVNAATSVRASSETEPWNREFYVSYGSGRSWADARLFGYVSGGGGSWYSQTLKMLSPGDRVWVKVPKTGYVGVGRVLEPVQPMRELVFATPDGERPAFSVLTDAPGFIERDKNPETAEYAVRIEWLDTVDTADAYDEISLFGNQNTVCQPTTPKWGHTVERQKARFSGWNNA